MDGRGSNSSVFMCRHSRAVRAEGQRTFRRFGSVARVGSVSQHRVVRLVHSAARFVSDRSSATSEAGDPESGAYSLINFSPNAFRGPHAPHTTR
jgi:hypothetical protein